MPQIVLIDPEIPQNTGSIARTCAATRAPLFLIGKLGFELSEKSVRRAGLDYWPWVDIKHLDTWQDFLNDHCQGTIWAFSKYGQKTYYDADFRANDCLVFGSETKGLGKDFLSTIPKDQILKIPMECEHVRSLNLSNAVSVGLYEALRQIAEDRPAD